MKRFAFILPFVFSLVILSLAVFSRFSYAELVINEILASPSIDWDGNGSYYYRDDEWVEVYNNSEETILLDGYRLTDSDSVWRYAFSGTLPAGGYLVVYGSDSYAWEKANDCPAYGLSLNNTGDTVRLWKHTGAGSFVVVDYHTYGSVEAGTDRSVGRKPDGAEEWWIFDALNPYTGTTPPLGTGCSPSPEASNDCTSPVESETWGRIKALFR